MDYDEKLTVVAKYASPVDANIVKGALEASGIPAGVIVDNTANAIWMSPARVVVFERDLELARQVISDTAEELNDTAEELNDASEE